MPANKPRRPTPQRVRPGVQRVLDAMVAAPAWVRNGRSDFLAGNRLGRALYAPIFKDPVRPANTARFTFLDPQAKAFYADWDRIANDMVGVLRAEAGRNPYDRSLTDLIGELSTRSEDFRVRWAAHNVRTHQTGQKRLHHPAVGDLDLTFEAMELRADPGLTLLVYTAEVGSRTQDALNLLATWSATFEQINDSQAARALESSGGGDLAMRSSATAELSGAFLGTRAGTPPHATD
jgi:hypothetical protein